MITQNQNPAIRENRPATRWTAETSPTGHYTDIDTLVRGSARRIFRPGSYTDVDTLTSPKSDAVRPGSYTDVDTLTSPKSDAVRPGSYVDMMFP